MPATTRRMFLHALGAAASAGASLSAARGAARAARGQAGAAAWRAQFPALQQQVNGRPLVYLDTAATAQRPGAVIDALTAFYRHDNANPGAALHTLARRSAEHYEGARQAVARFINARDPGEIVWTRGTTEGINLVAATWARANLKAGDEIVLTIAEHYSNLLPWRWVAGQAGATVRVVDVDEDGTLTPERVRAALSDRTRLVAFGHVSNVLGLINPAREICAVAHAAGARVLIDAAQSVPHIRVDVQDLDCDFLAFSSHKMAGPMGVGVLWARKELLEQMPPYQHGSNMAHDVEAASVRYSDHAWKFSAGTPNVSGPVGLAAAVRFLEGVGHDRLRAHEQSLVDRFNARVRGIDGVRVLGSPDRNRRIAVFAFVVEGVAVPDLVRTLDGEGLAIRGGDLAALPLLRRFGLAAANRASCYLYNTVEDIDRLGDALDAVPRGRARPA